MTYSSGRFGEKTLLNVLETLHLESRKNGTINITETQLYDLWRECEDLVENNRFPISKESILVKLREIISELSYTSIRDIEIELSSLVDLIVD